MTKEHVAAALDGSEYPLSPANSQCEEWKNAGLFVIWGESDDLVEIRGVADDEIDAYGGTVFSICRDGLPIEADDLNPNNAETFVRQHKSSVEVNAIWCAHEDLPPWTFTAEVPFAEFDIVEDGEVFCRGIVIDREDLPR